MFGNKENLNSSNLSQKRIQPTSKQTSKVQKEQIKDKEELQNNQFRSALQNVVLPNINELILSEVQVNSYLEKAIKVERAKEDELALAKESMLYLRSLEEARHEKEMLKVDCEVGQWKKQTSDMRATFDELQRELAALEKEEKSLREERDHFSLHLDRQHQEESLLKQSQECEEKKALELMEKMREAKGERDLYAERKRRVEQSVQETYFLYKKYLHAQLSEVRGNIRVFCRVRPILEEDLTTILNRASVISQRLSQNPKSCKQVISSKKRMDELLSHAKANHLPEIEETLELIDDQLIRVKAQPGIDKIKGDSNLFQFDKVIRPETTQEELFTDVVDLVRTVLDGENVCVFAYGQTGAGKTYTMEGDPNKLGGLGIIPRSIQVIFDAVEQYKVEKWMSISVSLSCIEIHKEIVRDLLDPENQTLQIMTNNQKFKAREQKVDTLEEVDIVLKKAKQNRKTGSTALNIASSRSHSIYRLKVHAYRSDSQSFKGTLNLIDLAGTERTAESQAVGERLEEAKAINKSLSCLGDVIQAIARGEAHVPYRNSKLTHLLQRYLGANAKILMIVNVSALPQNAYDTVTSLRFASKVNQCSWSGARKMMNS